MDSSSPELAAQYIHDLFIKATWQQLTPVIVLGATALWLGFSFALTTYRLYLHPLSKFPGPREAAVSDRWLYAQHKKGYPEATFEALHKQYNTNALRIAPDELHITDVGLYKRIYSQTNPFLKKSSFYKIFQTPGSLFAEVVPALHKEIRKALSPLFARAGILKLEPVITATVEEFVTKVKTLAGKGPINVYDAYRCVTVDVISQFAFGRPLGLLDENPDSFFNHFLKANNETGGELWAMYFTPALALLARLLPLDIVAKLDYKFSSVMTIHQFARSSLENYKRKTTTTSHPVIFDHLQFLTDQQQALEAVDILLAGADTTAFTLCIATHHISRDARVRQNLICSLKEAIPDPTHTPSLVELEKITYLYACVKEALRIATPVPGRLPRIVPDTKEPLIVDDRIVPPGTIVGMSAYTMNRSTLLWGADAHLFNPDRWLGDGGKRLNDNMCSFSKGARQCIGINVAHAELTLVLARIYRQFEMRVDTHGFTVRDIFISDVTSHEVLVEFRELKD